MSVQITSSVSLQQQPPPEKKYVYIKTYGCQMNAHDSDRLLQQLSEHDYEATEHVQQADLILLNTCAIRQKAEDKVYSLLGRLSLLKQQHPDTLIGVGGCVAQQKGADILRRSPAVDVVFGTDQLFELPSMLERAKKGEKVCNTEWKAPTKGYVENFIPPASWPVQIPVTGSTATENAAEPTKEQTEPLRIKDNIAITKGCNNFCSFCVVPYTRGKEVSREAGNIVQEAEQMAKQGIKEIMLLGQNVNSYKARGVRFVELLKQIDAIDGIERIRYTSSHPKDFKNELIVAHQTLPSLCEHLHLPFQSGSNRILQLMERNHTIEHYLEKMDAVKKAIPEIALSSDMIVGFPGETDADFEATLQVMRHLEFEHIYAFKYSQRTQTPASLLSDQLSDSIKSARLNALLTLHEAIQKKKLNNLLNSRQQVLVEGPHPKLKEMWVGKTRGNRPVTLPDGKLEIGQLVNIDVVAIRNNSLVGKVC